MSNGTKKNIRMNSTTCAWIEDEVCRCCLIKTSIDGYDIVYCDYLEENMKDCPKYKEVKKYDL